MSFNFAPKIANPMDVKKFKSLSKRLIETQKKISGLNKSAIEIAVKANDIEVKNILRKPQIVKKIDRRDWKGLHNESKSQYQKCSQLIENFIDLTGKRVEQTTTRNEALDEFKPYMKPVKGLKDWQERKASIRTQLKAKGIDNKSINRFFKNVENFDFKKSISLNAEIGRWQDGISLNAFNKLLKAFVTQYYAYCCSQANISYESSAKRSITDTQIKKQERDVNDAFQEIKNLLKKDDAQVDKYCKALESRITKNLNTNLLPIASALYKKRTRDKKAFDLCLENSVRIGVLIRKSILLLAVSKRLRFYSTNRKALKNYAQWVGRSSIKGFDEPIKSTLVRFGSLASRGGSYSNKKITVKGRVVKVQIRHLRKKPISHLFITDGKYIIMATIPHIKADSGGMSPGAYVQASGVWRQRSKEAFNKQSLDIDRVDHTKASKRYWLSWLSLEMNDIYEMVPHSLNAKISWKPGNKGAINQVTYSLV